jgi:hypothetical protein
MRVLFDQGTPAPLRTFLSGHEVVTAFEMGWAELSNGKLLSAAEAAGFAVLLTTDKNLKYQQNLSMRKVAILVLPTTQWPVIREHTDEVASFVDAASPGIYREIRWD